jgi:hypothetical protein
MGVPNIVKREVSESAVVSGLKDVLERWAVGTFPIGCVFVGDENRPRADFETGSPLETIAGTGVVYDICSPERPGAPLPRRVR